MSVPVTSGLLALTLAIEAMIPDIACIFAGIFGGAIMQLLTMENRNVSKSFRVGDILASGTMGWTAFVIQYLAGFDMSQLRLGLLMAIVFGATGSMGFLKLVEWLKPEWLGGKGGKPDG